MGFHAIRSTPSFLMIEAISGSTPSAGSWRSQRPAFKNGGRIPKPSFNPESLMYTMAHFRDAPLLFRQRNPPTEEYGSLMASYYRWSIPIEPPATKCHLQCISRKLLPIGKATHRKMVF